MSNPPRIACFCLAIAVSMLGIGAQNPPSTAQSKPQPESQPATRPAPSRPKVVIIGASVSSGFADPTSRGADGTVNRTFKLDVALRKGWPRELCRIFNYSDLMMFMQSATSAKKQLASALARKPDLILGIDFMVWLGYGAVRDRVEEGEVDAKRLAVQEDGLALLETVQCPIVLGDYPDMRGASTQMLPRYMIPNKATLDALNANLRAWAAKRKNVSVFPLASFVQEAVTKPQVYDYGERKVVFPKNYLLQSDRLHATRLGMLVVALRLTEALPTVLPKGHPLLAAEVTLPKLVAAAGLEEDVPGPDKDEPASGKPTPGQPTPGKPTPGKPGKAATGKEPKPPTGR